MRQVNKEVREGVFRFKLFSGLAGFGALVGAIGYVKYIMHEVGVAEIDLPTLFARWVPILIHDKHFLLSMAVGAGAGLMLGWIFTRNRGQSMDARNERPGMRQN